MTSDPGLQFRVVDAFGDRPPFGRSAGGDHRVLQAGSCAAELDGAIHALQAAGARRRTLPPLGADAVGELVSEMLSAQPGPDLLAEISGAPGNPLFVTELLAALQQEGGGRACARHAEDSADR